MMNKRIPSLLSIVFLASALVAIGWISKNALSLAGKAAGGNTPHDIRITNVTDAQFTVSYTTDESVLGTVSYGTDNALGGLGLDDRDKQAGNPSPHHVHFITVTALQPTTAYLFTIISGNGTFLQNNQPYTITTAPTLSGKGLFAKKVTGSVGLSDGTVPQEALAYLSIDGAQPLTVLVKTNGEYNFSLTQTRLSSLATFATIADNTAVTLELQSATDHSKVNFFAGKGNPVPSVTLSKNYDFTANGASSVNTAPTASSSGFPAVKGIQSSSVQLTTPQTQQGLSDQQPVFKGQAEPNSTVQIQIHSTQVIQTTVQTDSSGNWQFRPSSTLTPGQHTVTIIAMGIDGITKTITRQFTVYAQGSQFAAPSVSPAATNTPTPTLRPTATPTLRPTATPTPRVIALAPTATPTLRPTATPTPRRGTPTPTKTASQAALAKIPASGSSVFDIGMLIALMAIGFGTILFFSTRKETSSWK